MLLQLVQLFILVRLNLHVPNVQNLPELLERQEQKRLELKAYAYLMNTKVGNQLELTLHQVMWRAELNRMRCGDCASAPKSPQSFVIQGIKRSTEETMQ